MSRPDDNDLDEYGLGFERRSAPAPTLQPGSKADPGPAGPAPGPLGALGSLAQLAAERFGRHPPVVRPVRPAYWDSTQITIPCSGTFQPSAWASSDGTPGTLPTISGVARIFKAFKPNKAIIDGRLTTTFAEGGRTKDVIVTLADGNGLILIGAYAGAKNCFPCQHQDAGIDGRAFSQHTLGSGFSWPSVSAGVDFSMRFAVEESVLYRATPPPSFSASDLVSVKIDVRLAMFGPALR